jgi:hypothetical protein
VHSNVNARHYKSIPKPPIIGDAHSSTNLTSHHHINNDKHIPAKHGREVRQGCHVNQVYIDSAVDDIPTEVTCTIEANEGAEAGETR